MIVKMSRELKELGATRNRTEPNQRDKIKKARNKKLNGIHALLKDK